MPLENLANISTANNEREISSEKNTCLSVASSGATVVGTTSGAIIGVVASCLTIPVSLGASLISSCAAITPYCGASSRFFPPSAPEKMSNLNIPTLPLLMNME